MRAGGGNLARFCMPDMKALRAFSSARFGNVHDGQILVAVSDALAEHLQSNKLAEPVQTYQTKVVRQEPEAPKPKRRPAPKKSAKAQVGASTGTQTEQTGSSSSPSGTDTDSTTSESGTPGTP